MNFLTKKKLSFSISKLKRCPDLKKSCQQKVEKCRPVGTVLAFRQKSQKIIIDLEKKGDTMERTMLVMEKKMREMEERMKSFTSGVVPVT